MNNPAGWEIEQQSRRARETELREKGVCPTCHDLEIGGAFYGLDNVIFEDDLFKVVLERFPRTKGHTIVLYKPHRADLSELSDKEAGLVFAVCVRVVRALKAALGAEKVYLNTICDGAINHLHLQLFPRYSGELIGSSRFVTHRSAVLDSDDLIRKIRAELRLPLPGGDSLLFNGSP